ncbi:MAG: hypothetical protein MJB14_06695 [Spirochaetes bacterium]|nr:hypothetical protein [Spirochaetota bacterium]
MLNNLSKQRKKILLFFILLLITYLIRIPFLPEKISFNNDAVIYSKNIEKDFFSQSYDVHMPGYISYIYLGRFFYSFTDNTIIIQHLINIILIGLIICFLFQFLNKLGFPLLESFCFSLLFSFNNVLLLGTVTGGNRMFLALCSILLMSVAYEIMVNNKAKWLLLYALLYAFFIGFRQDISFYFFPLYILVMIYSKDLKWMIYSLLIFTGICLTWFIPLVLEYGGFFSYFHILRNYETIQDSSFLFSGFSLSPIINIIRIFIYLFNTLLFILPLFFISKKDQQSADHKIIQLLAFAFFPPFIFQLLVHNGNFVQLAAFLPPVFIYLLLKFRLKTIRRKIGIVLILALLFFQFYGIKMFPNPTNFYKKAFNIIWLQYSYDGVQSEKTLRLKMLTE